MWTAGHQLTESQIRQHTVFCTSWHQFTQTQILLQTTTKMHWLHANDLKCVGKSKIAEWPEIQIRPAKTMKPCSLKINLVLASIPLEDIIRTDHSYVLTHRSFFRQTRVEVFDKTFDIKLDGFANLHLGLYICKVNLQLWCLDMFKFGSYVCQIAGGDTRRWKMGSAGTAGAASIYRVAEPSADRLLYLHATIFFSHTHGILPSQMSIAPLKGGEGKKCFEGKRIWRALDAWKFDLGPFWSFEIFHEFWNSHISGTGTIEVGILKWNSIWVWLISMKLPWIAILHGPPCPQHSLILKIFKLITICMWYLGSMGNSRLNALLWSSEYLSKHKTQSGHWALGPGRHWVLALAIDTSLGSASTEQMEPENLNAQGMQ